MLEELTSLVESPLGIWETLIRVGCALLASVVAYLMYQLFYGSSHIGAGVHRTFLIGGPAITMIFLVIQTSIPLGIGLLGALSFVRFRTPIKDPAEIGFLLLLIASSIGTATGNLIPTVILFGVVFVALGLQRIISSRITLSGQGHLMISVDKLSFPEFEEKLKAFLKSELRGLRFETMSTMDNRISLQYQYQRRSNYDWSNFTNELNRLADTAKVEIYVG
ncbi:MAG: hypothetical protein A2158_06365 [Chloroflexi bacterium RBG_13_46_14]|nr:MAG: hypothetical protein A2158_06365 [Chloroflexi bacterium RBG_13_46_14]